MPHHIYVYSDHCTSTHSQHSPISTLIMFIRLQRICLFALGLFAISSAIAEDYFAMLDVRCDTGLKKTFLGGPYKDKPFCEKNNKTVWDNVQPVCGNCKREL